MSFKFITQVPEDAGKVVGITVFQDRVIVVAEFRVYQLFDDVLVPLKFQDESE